MYVVGYYQNRGIKICENENTPEDLLNHQGWTLRMPGDPVPEAELWKDHVIKANLARRIIQTEVDYNGMVSSEPSAKNVHKMSIDQTKMAQREQIETDMDSEGKSYDTDKVTKAQLVAMCKQKGLPYTGNKTTLISRIKQA